jgi:hypothetical protein
MCYVNVYAIFQNLSKCTFINVYLHQQFNVYKRLVNNLSKLQTLSTYAAQGATYYSLL